MAKFSWKDAPDLMADLVSVQNHPSNEGRDIMSFAGFMDSRAELELYVGRHEIAAQNWDQDQEYARRVA